jgi:hypothetical protein
VSTRARYNLPVGPIRLDYNYSPSPASVEAMGAFHFSISRGLNSKMSASIERLIRTFLQYRAESRAVSAQKNGFWKVSLTALHNWNSHLQAVAFCAAYSRWGHGARSTKQPIAIGLSKASRAGGKACRRRRRESFPKRREKRPLELARSDKPGPLGDLFHSDARCVRTCGNCVFRDRKRFPVASLPARTTIRQIRAAFVIVVLAPNRVLLAANRS